MIKRSFTYTDYNGNERNEEHLFNLSKAELIDLELSVVGGYKQLIENIIAAQDLPSLYKYFKELILKSYGIKSPDGKRFIKQDENGRPLVNDFIETEAYSILLEELVTNTEKASEFVNGIMPTVTNKPTPIPATK